MIMKRILLLLSIIAVAAACSEKGGKDPAVSDDWTENAVIYEFLYVFI